MFREHSFPGTDVKNYVNENNNFIAPTSVSNKPLYNSNKPTDDLVIKNANINTVGSGTLAHNYKVGSRIPNTFYANTSLIPTWVNMINSNFPARIAL